MLLAIVGFSDILLVSMVLESEEMLERTTHASVVFCSLMMNSATFVNLHAAVGRGSSASH
jgi:hypothetical protein